MGAGAVLAADPIMCEVLKSTNPSLYVTKCTTKNPKKVQPSKANILKDLTRKSRRSTSARFKNNSDRQQADSAWARLSAGYEFGVEPTTTVIVEENRSAILAGIQKPSTGDDANDKYVYAVRLYYARLYPEAQVEIKEFIAKYPAHQRMSYARFLLGRAYLAEGKPALASVQFYDNYQKLPRGDRAPSSLAYLGEALIKLDKPTDACKVFIELKEVYGGAIDSVSLEIMNSGKARANCGS